MSTCGAKEPPIIGCLNGKNLLIVDLNNAPLEGLDRMGSNEGGQPSPTIDVDAIDDDVVESSQTAFEEAKSKRSHRRAGFGERIKNGKNLDNKRRRVNPTNTSKQNPEAPPPPKPKEHPFSCPICFNPPVEEMSTKCGHIFCDACIRAAIAKRALCPICRSKVTTRQLNRVYLPTAY